MDSEFVLRNQIVERYLGGRLPVKGAQDFEQFCRSNPELLDQINLTDRIHSALRLLEAGGHAPPWEQPPPKFWQQLPTLIGIAALALILGVTALILGGKLGASQRSVSAWQHRAAAQSLDPAQSTRTITVIPSRTAPSRHSLVSIGGSQAQMADLKFDVSWSKFTSFQVTIDRIDQGRVAILHNVAKDSNGNVHLAINSSALGPGDYQFTIEGLNWRGEPLPQAWATISIMH